MLNLKYKLMCKIYKLFKISCKCGQFRGEWGYQHIISGRCKRYNKSYDKSHNLINKIKDKIYNLLNLNYVKIVKHDYDEVHQNIGFYLKGDNYKEFDDVVKQTKEIKGSSRHSAYASYDMYGVDEIKAINQITDNFKTTIFNYTK